MSHRPSSGSATFSKHALEQMAFRKISREEVLCVHKHGRCQLQPDGKLRYSIDVDTVTWSPDGDNSLSDVADIVVVAGIDNTVVTLFRKESADASRT